MTENTQKMVKVKKGHAILHVPQSLVKFAADWLDRRHNATKFDQVMIEFDSREFEIASIAVVINNLGLSNVAIESGYNLDHDLIGFSDSGKPIRIEVKSNHTGTNSFTRGEIEAILNHRTAYVVVWSWNKTGNGKIHVIPSVLVPYLFTGFDRIDGRLKNFRTDKILKHVEPDYEVTFY